MKRYKVGEIIWVAEDSRGRLCIPAGTEICLEEVGERACKLCGRSLRDGHYCGTGTFRGDWGGNTTTIDQPKEEKVCEKCERGMYRICDGGRGKCEFNCDCHNQPLTPKDVGMRNGQAIICFESWLDAKNIDLFYVKDEDYEPMYQKFLKSCKK